MENMNKLRIPSNVPCTRIKYFCSDCFSGGTPSTKNPLYYLDDSGIPWIASGKLHDCFVTTPTCFISDLGLYSSSTRLVKKGSPMIAMTGATCSNVGLLSIDACTNQSIFSYELKNNVYPLFVFYSLIAARQSVLLNQLGGAQAGINGYVCKNIYIPNYSYQEQVRIGDFLNNKCSAIDKKIGIEKEKISQLEKLRYSLITEACSKGINNNEFKRTDNFLLPEIPSSWSITKIKYNCYLKGRIGWQGLTADEYKEEGPYLITGTDFENGKINWETCVHITEKRYDEAYQIQIKENDLLITKDGTIGKVAIVRNMPGRTSLNSGVMVIRNVSNKYITSFLYYCLQSDIFWKWYEYNSRGQSTISHLYQEQFSGFQFPLPSISEQEEIVKYLDCKIQKIDRLIQIKKEKIEKLESLKTSVIYEYVTKQKEVE